MAENEHTPNIPAWLQLYLAKSPQSRTRIPHIKPVGRPSRLVPAKQTSIWLTAGDREIISSWQKYIKSLTGQSISIGETLSLLARICKDRLDALGGQDQFQNLSELVLAMVEGKQDLP
jgi:hypothetical protein